MFQTPLFMILCADTIQGARRLVLSREEGDFI